MHVEHLSDLAQVTLVTTVTGGLVSLLQVPEIRTAVGVLIVTMLHASVVIVRRKFKLRSRENIRRPRPGKKQ